MIDLSEEPLISLTEAARLVPPGRRGKPTHLSTLLRWVNPGLGGVRLEAVRLGGRWLTSRQALARFAARLTVARTAPTADLPALPARRPTPSAVDRELDRIGIS